MRLKQLLKICRTICVVVSEQLVAVRRPDMGSVCYADYLRTMPFQDLMNPCKNSTRETIRTLLREYSVSERSALNAAIVHLLGGVCVGGEGGGEGRS